MTIIGYSQQATRKKKTRENLSFNFMVLPDVISLNVDLREYTNASVSWTITKAALYFMARDDDSPISRECNVNFLDHNSKARRSCLGTARFSTFRA